MCSRVNVVIVAGSDHGTVHTYACFTSIALLRGMYMCIPEAYESMHDLHNNFPD